MSRAYAEDSEDVAAASTVDEGLVVSQLVIRFSHIHAIGFQIASSHGGAHVIGFPKHTFLHAKIDFAGSGITASTFSRYPGGDKP
jgi:hypothetical protein